MQIRFKAKIFMQITKNKYNQCEISDPVNKYELGFASLTTIDNHFLSHRELPQRSIVHENLGSRLNDF